MAVSQIKKYTRNLGEMANKFERTKVRATSLKTSSNGVRVGQELNLVVLSDSFIVPTWTCFFNGIRTYCSISWTTYLSEGNRTYWSTSRTIYLDHSLFPLSKIFFLSSWKKTERFVQSVSEIWTSLTWLWLGLILGLSQF